MTGGRRKEERIVDNSRPFINGVVLDPDLVTAVGSINGGGVKYSEGRQVKG